MPVYRVELVADAGADGAALPSPWNDVALTALGPVQTGAGTRAGHRTAYVDLDLPDDPAEQGERIAALSALVPPSSSGWNASRSGWVADWAASDLQDLMRYGS